jgi:molybdate transport repressor ModE-like protein
VRASRAACAGRVELADFIFERRMNWNDVQHFLAVAAGGGLPAAARDLGVSQITAWRHIRRLEETLKVRLFEERKGGYVVSPDGLRLLEAARRIEHELQEALHALEGADDAPSGEVRITAPEVIGSALLAGQLPALRAQAPLLRVELVAGSPVMGLARRETDIALRYDEQPHGEFVKVCAAKVGFGIYASPAYVDEHGVPERIDRFAGHALIAFDDTPGHVAPGRWQVKGGKGAAIAFRSNSVHSRMAAARAGLGCTLLPCVLGDADAGLVRLLGPKSVGWLDLTVFVNRRVQDSPRVALVSRFVQDVLRDAGDRLAG